jgi:oligoendopeptidase F
MPALVLLTTMTTSLFAAAAPERKDIRRDDTWDLSVMYPSLPAWEAHAREITGWVESFAALKGTIAQSAQNLLAALRWRDRIQVNLEKLGAYAAMRHHEDMRLTEPQALQQRAQTLSIRYAEAASWFNPELLQIPESKLRGWLDQEDLQIYRHFIDDLLRTRQHILSPREEELLAMAGKATEAASDIHSLLANTELRWRKVKNPEGQEVEITAASFYQAVYSKDRRYRQEAVAALHHSHLDVKNTLAASLAGAMHRDWYFAKARHYGTTLEASLDAENLPISVYHNLLKTVDAHLPLLHRYVALKQKALGIEAVHFYDLYVNLVDVPTRSYTFAEARDLVLAGTQPFGEEYGSVLQRAFAERWIDVYANQGKMSGAYNMGTYLAPPYVLLNYQGTFNDVSTLAHELGHAMQSWFAKENQPPVYAGYPMFTAEVASTAAEIVFKQFMLSRTQDPKERAFLINQMLEDMRGTVFRQTQFAEFDLAAHQLAEKGEPITAEALMDIGRAIYVRYYGPKFVIDDGLNVEVLRIPHYYRNYYVYRYATSYCAAAAIAQRILRQEPGAVADWMKFLKLGNSRFALDMLKVAGVDMTTPKPIADAMSLFDTWLGELERLLAGS